MFNTLSTGLKSYYDQIPPSRSLEPFLRGFVLQGIRMWSAKSGFVAGFALQTAVTVTNAAGPLFGKINNANIHAVLETFTTHSIISAIITGNLRQGLKNGSFFAATYSAALISFNVLQPLVQKYKLLEKSRLPLDLEDFPQNWGIKFLSSLASNFAISVIYVQSSQRSALIQSLFISTINAFSKPALIHGYKQRNGYIKQALDSLKKDFDKGSSRIGLKISFEDLLGLPK